MRYFFKKKVAYWRKKLLERCYERRNDEAKISQGFVVLFLFSYFFNWVSQAFSQLSSDRNIVPPIFRPLAAGSEPRSC